MTFSTKLKQIKNLNLKEIHLDYVVLKYLNLNFFVYLTVFNSYFLEHE